MRLLSLIFCFSCSVWSSLTLGGGCDPSSIVTSDILACVTLSHDAVDKKLNNQYKALMRNADPSHKKLLVNSQRAWIKYRDARCEETYDSISPGEEAGIERVSCRASMTSSRLTELNYIETGVPNGSFYGSLSMLIKLSSKERDEIIDYINDGAVISEGVEYLKKNCELTGLLYQENRRTCNARVRLQDM